MDSEKCIFTTNTYKFSPALHRGRLRACTLCVSSINTMCSFHLILIVNMRRPTPDPLKMLSVEMSLLYILFVAMYNSTHPLKVPSAETRVGRFHPLKHHRNIPPLARITEWGRRRPTTNAKTHTRLEKCICSLYLKNWESMRGWTCISEANSHRGIPYRNSILFQNFLHLNECHRPLTFLILK